jgi:hypothetical protein
MANGNDDPRIYNALALPDAALEKGGMEILRIGLIDDNIYVAARPSLKHHAQWGQVLAEAARRIGAIYAAQIQGLSRKDATIAIAEAFAAEFGARPVKPAKTAAKSAVKKPAKRVRPAPRRKKR